MPYTALLNKLIENSNLTVKEIAEHCTESGTKITAAYISTLRNATDNRSPSDDVSRALAKACGAKNENVLVIEAYLDKAPKEFSGLMSFVRNAVIETIAGAFENQFPKEMIDKVREQVQKMPVADLVISLNEQETTDFTKQLGTLNITHDEKYTDWNLHAELKRAVGFEVKDDSMFPTIPKGSKVTLEMKTLPEYTDGDILAFIKKGEQDIQYRKVVFLDEEHNAFAMIPINSEYSTKTYTAKDVTVLGKATQVISEL